MVKGVATSIITVAVLMGSLVACSGSDSEVTELREELEDLRELPRNAILSLEEKVYYSDQCSVRSLRCEDWIEKLASEILDSTEQEKQNYLVEFIRVLDCTGFNQSIYEVIWAIEREGTDWLGPTPIPQNSAEESRNNYYREQYIELTMESLEEALILCPIPDFLED